MPIGPCGANRQFVDALLICLRKTTRLGRLGRERKEPIT